jgi:hypothetical protein
MTGIIQKIESRKTETTPWWVWIVAIDLFLVSVTAVFPHLPSFPGKSILFGPFNLATEMNIAAWWAGISFFFLSILAFELFCSRTDGTRLAWLFLSVLLFALFCDEVGSIHERIRYWSRLLPIGLGALLLLAYSLIVLHRIGHARKTVFFILCGFALFGTVAVQEYLEHHLNWPDWMSGLRTGVEEGTELAGTFLILWGLLHRNKRGSGHLIEAVPDFYRIRNIRAIIFCGLLVHIAASFILPGFIEFGRRGNPLVLYPAAVYIVLFSGSFWNYLTRGSGDKGTFGWLAAFFAISSMGSVFNLFNFLPGARSLIPAGFNSAFHSLHLLQLFVIGLLFMRRSAAISHRKIIVLPILLLLLSHELFFRALSMEAVLSGVISWLVAEIFLPGLSLKKAEVRDRLAVPEPVSVNSERISTGS